MKYIEIKRFYGLDQSVDENLVPQGYSPFAYNMDTEDGNLAVAKGFVKLIDSPVPGDEIISRLAAFNSSAGKIHIVLAGKTVYACKDGDWVAIHTYDWTDKHIGFNTLETNINGAPVLLMADGIGQMLKYDGEHITEFGSEDALSNRPVLHMASYFSRLFCAGDTQHPNRLYYSKLPGDGRTIEDWGANEASSSVEGGHIEIGSGAADAIIGLVSLSGELLILKERSLYRLLGNRPSNFVVELVESDMYRTVYTSVVKHGDRVYFLTPSGLCLYDGVALRLMGDAKRIRNIMRDVNITSAKAARTRTKLYFAVRYGDADAIITYDLVNRTYMLRNGFSASDILGAEDELYLINDARYVYQFERGDDYDGQPISAYWRTPVTDLGQKALIKKLETLYIRGEGMPNAKLVLTAAAGNSVDVLSRLMPEVSSRVLEIPLCGEGRTLWLAFANEAGARFVISGGLELAISTRWRTV